MKERLAAIEAAIRAACARSGRERDEITLLGASKGQPAAAVRAAAALGVRDFGENYATELRDKSRELADIHPRWHFIGTLQRNKVRLVVGTAALIHTLDGPDLLAEVAARARARLPGGGPQLCLVEVNLGGEARKGGLREAELPALLDAVAEAGGAVRCLGLMCIPPAHPDPEASRPYFRRLRELCVEERRVVRPHVELVHLSMGMSHDLEVAVEEGATILRIGSALFGPRPARSAA